MNNRTMILILLVMSIGLNVASVEEEDPDSPVFPKNTNLLANPGFEQVVGETPTRWNLFVEPREGAYGRIDHEHVFDGKLSVVLYNPEAYPAEPANNWSQNIIQDLSEVELIISGRIRTLEATEAALWIQCWSKAPVRLLHGATTSTDSPVYGTQDWAQVEMNVKAPEGTHFVTLRCVLLGRGTAWFDDLNISKTSSEDTEDSNEKENDDIGPDKDSDGLADIVETNTRKYVSRTNTGTDPNNPDTDGDGLADGYEVKKGFDPIKKTDAKKIEPDVKSQDVDKTSTEKSGLSIHTVQDKNITETLIESNKAMVDTNQALRDTNRLLIEQLLLLQQEIDNLRKEINGEMDSGEYPDLMLIEPETDSELSNHKDESISSEEYVFSLEDMP